MGVVLYRKYRSKSLDEVVGQKHITETLSKALKQGKIAHAYLLTGPRGVGKTSVARILAHEVNGLPYDEVSTHIDIIEIDAASNRRIDEIRELRDRIHIAPALAKYKVYIIDEVHMLTKEAFNALLKTLEEPPEHAIFILATTEAHKLPETIISRTQRYSFKPIQPSDIVNHLSSIAKREKISIDVQALDEIALHSQGSFRDSISMLDQVSGTSKKVTKEDIDSLLGLAPEKVVNKLLDAYYQGNSKDILEVLLGCQEAGYNPSILSKQLSEKLQFSLSQQAKDGSLNGATMRLLHELLEVSVSHDPFITLELALLGNSSSALPSATPDAEPETIKQVVTESNHRVGVKEPPSPIRTEKSEEPSEPNETWLRILQAAKDRHNTLYSVLRMADASLEKEELRLTFAFPFHKKRIEDTKSQEMLQEIIVDVVGTSVQVISVVDGSKRPSNPQIENSTSGDNLQTISNIFGETEVLE